MTPEDEFVTREEYNLLAARCDALWQRTVALETLMTLAVSRLVVIDDDTGTQIESILEQFASGEIAMAQPNGFNAFHSEKIGAYLSRVLLAASNSIQPPLRVHPRVQGRIESALKDQT